MSNLIPFDFDTHMVRVVMRAGEPWFIAADVAAVLGYSHPPHMVRHLDEDEAAVHNVDSSGQFREMTIISESGLYAAVLKSRKEEARRFRKWVTAELLPTLRRTGRYAVGEAASPAAALPVLAEMETQRLTAIVAVVRMGERLYGRPAAQQLWADLGLPDYGLDTDAVFVRGLPDDPLAAPLERWLEGQESATISECLHALGLGKADFTTRRRIGDALRAMGWRGRVDRSRGQPQRVFRRIG